MQNPAEEELRIAAIGGDGIGPDVVHAAVPLVRDAARRDGVTVVVTELDWGDERLLRTGSAMPADAVDTARAHHAIFLGAVGHPRIAPEVSVWTLVLALRKALDLYVNLRPVVMWPGVSGPLSDGAGADFVVVRENTEGEYAGIGGRAHAGTEAEVATDVAVHSRRAVERVTRYAFALAREREQRLSLVTKSNVSRHGYALWDEVLERVGAEEFPDVEREKVYVDAMAARMVQRPRSLGVLLCSNLFGDILSDLAAALQGGLGLAPSANVCPGTHVPGLFEPVHGSAPDIAGHGIANPVAAILSGALLLRENGCPRGAEALERAVRDVLARGAVRTPDIGGEASTEQMADAVHGALARLAPEAAR
jgi:tartrate dehydrogenase/decarboxylase/D-malate dehydrogenase